LETRAPARAGRTWALFIMGFATFLNLYTTQPLLPEFRQAFGASELLVSLTVSAPVLAVALAAPILGVLADALGRKRVIVTALLGLAVPTALAASAASLGQLVFWRFAQGLCIPGIIAVAMAYISEETPNHRVGSTMATYVTGTVAGGFCGRFAAGLVAAHWGWRPAFVLLGTATFLGALATWQLLPRSTRFRRQLDPAASWSAVRGHLRNPQLLATYAAGFNVLFCLVGAFTYVNFYLADAPFHLGPAALASLFSVYLVGTVVTPLAGRALDRVGCRRGLVGATALGATGLVLTLWHSLPLIIAGLTLAACGTFISQSAAASQVGKVAGRARSSAAGLYVGVYYLGGGCGSLLPGVLWKPGGWAACVGLLLLVQGLTAWIAWRLWPVGDLPAQPEEPATGAHIGIGIAGAGAADVGKWAQGRRCPL
jgi:predicted MFS family arabinose efflux permease